MGGYGRFVGRVGMLALALGVGMGVADGCGVALADPASGPRQNAGTADSSAAESTATNAGPRRTTPRRASSARTQLGERLHTAVAETQAKLRESVENFSQPQGLARGEKGQPDAGVRSRSVTGRFLNLPRPQNSTTANVASPAHPVTGEANRSITERTPRHAWLTRMNEADRDGIRAVRAIADTATDQRVHEGARRQLRSAATLELPAREASEDAPPVADRLAEHVSSVAPSTAFLTAGTTPVAAATPAAASPATVITRLMSVGLGTFALPHAPAGPTDSPLMWTLLAWVRRQPTNTVTTPTLPVQPAAVQHLPGTATETLELAAVAGSNPELAAATSAAAAALDPQFIETGEDTTAWQDGQLATSADGRYIYAINFGGQQLSIIDTQTNTVVATTTTMGNHVTTNPGTPGAVYITNVNATQSDTYDIYVHDGATGEYLRTISIPEIPNKYPGGTQQWGQDFAISSDESTIVTTVRQQDRWSSESTVKVVTYNRNTHETKVIDLGPLVPGASPYAGHVTLSPDGREIYVPITPSNSAQTSYDPGIAIIDTETGEIKDFLSGPNYTANYVVSPDGEHIYMLREGSNGQAEVAVLNPADRSIATVVTLPNDHDNPDVGVVYPTDMITLSPDGTTLYVVHRGYTNGTDAVAAITAVDLEAGTYGTPVTFTGEDIVFEPIVSRDGTRLYATGYDTATNAPYRTGVWVIDATAVPVSGGGAGGGPSTEVPESATLTAIREQAQRLADAIRAVTNHQDRPRVPDAQNNQAEVDWERNWEVFNLYVGWIPGVSTVLNAISLAVDFQDARQAWIDGDAEGFRDEANDLFGDAVGMIPVLGGPISYFIQYMFALADETDGASTSNPAAVPAAVRLA